MSQADSTDGLSQGAGASSLSASGSGPARLSFASASDIEEFIHTLERYERGEIDAEQWRKFRLVRGVYGQRQDDVQMVRVKVPQGVLSAEALYALAGACEQWSRGFAHITTRQNIQMHFVKLADASACMERLAAAGLTTREACGDSVRNIVACPFAGICSTEAFDVTPYSRALTRHLLRHPLSSSLPRKFKIAFSGCESDCGQGAFHDIGFRARLRGQNGTAEKGFQVTVGGGTATLCQAGWLLYDFVAADQILTVAEAIVRVFHKHGSRRSKAHARMKYLVRDIGWSRWKELYEEELAAVLDAGAIPLPFDPQQPPSEQAPDDPRPSAPGVVEIARRAAAAELRGPGIIPRTSPPRATSWSVAELRHFLRTNVREQRQNGYVAVTVHVPMGDLTGPQFRVLADLALAYGDGSVRTTTSQDVVLRWVEREQVPELYVRLCAAGLGRPDANTVADVTSCPGAESCRLAVTQSRGLGHALSEFLESRPDLVQAAADATIRVSGCPNGCSQHHVATLGFQGGMRRVQGAGLIPQYQLFVGGGVDGGQVRFGRRSVKIPAHRITRALERLLLWYANTHREGETAADFFRRADLDAISVLLADLCEVTAGNVRPDEYVDLGETEAFVVEIKDGDCAA
jgi:sulfite reductase beta subunit-like hemoprotein